MLTYLYIINFIIAIIIIFLERRDPTTTLAWIVILFAVPVLGGVLYIFFSQQIARQKIFKFTATEEKYVNELVDKQHQAILEDNFEFCNDVSYKWRNLIKLNNVCGNSYYSQDNDIDIIIDGNEKIRKLLHDIDNAKYKVYVEYFIIKKDIVGDALLEKLIKKAKEGLDVRLLVDSFGARNINDKLVEKLLESGGKFADFFPTKWKFFTTKINYRNHRKIVVIDDEIGYIGGFNVAREYVGLKKKFGYWRDTHLRVMGSSVNDMLVRFALDWRCASNEPISVTRTLQATNNNVGTIGMQIVSNGPDDLKEEVKIAFLKMINGAEKQIFIQTPYFVPDDAIMQALKIAAQSGIDVRIMIPCMPDHMFVYWATYSYCAELLDVGAKIYIYDDGFMHAKVMTVDGEIATVGSTNFDRRSFRLNFEVNAFIYDSDVTLKLEEAFENDMISSHLLTKELYKQRSFIIKIKEPISRLLSDIL